MRFKYFAAIILILGFSASPLFAFDESMTIHELAAGESVPVKALAEELGLDFAGDSDRSLRELGVSSVMAEDALRRYRSKEPAMVGSIVLTGMLIVFASLLVVALFIGLFKHVHVFERLRNRKAATAVQTEGLSIRSRGDMSERSIAAVITAIFLHEEEVESANRLLLTWKRTSASLWKTSNRELPNTLHTRYRRGRK